MWRSGRGGRVGARRSRGRGPGPNPPRVLQPPGRSDRRIPGPRERDPSPRSPPSRRPPPRGSPARGPLPRGRAGVSRGGRAAPPTARPLPHPRPLSPPSLATPATGPAAGGRGAPGAGRTVPSAPRAGRAVGPGGSRCHAQASARGRRRCRPPTRPVLKHGPRSLTRARVRGSHESRRGAMKVKAGGSPAGRGGIPRPLQSAEGAPPARLARRAGEVEHERTC